MSRVVVPTINKARTTTERLTREFEQRIVASPPGVCPVDMLLSFLKVCHAQTCGKCVPCRVGLAHLELIMEDILNDKGTMKSLALLEETAKSIQQSADCAIGFEAARMVLTGIEGFREDFISHIVDKKCISVFEQPVPCVTLCPAHVDIPGYVALVGEGRYADAVKLIRKDNPFPTACALVCEHPCEARCRRNMIDSSINIRGIKRFAVDNAPADQVEVPANAPSTGKRVAIVGGGPSGLTAAYFLQLMGHQTTVYEEKEKLGGMLRYGIPNYRFPRERLDQDLAAILSTGIEVKTNINVGKDVTIEQLHKEYDAVYIAIGAHIEKKLHLEGVDAKGVISAVNVLREVGYDRYPDYTGKDVVVVGGGNVAMDCARTAIRANANKVSVVYRRRQKDMTALEAEIESAIAEGVELLTLKAPQKIEVDEDGNAIALWVRPQISGTMDGQGRPSALNADKEQERIPCDVILMAVGQDVVSGHFRDYGLPMKWNCINAKEDTSLEGVDGIFAGGDCETGPSTVIMAIAAGKAAAANIDTYLGFNHEISCDVEIPQPKLNDKVPSGRVHLTEREACERKCDFEGVENNMSLEEALQETSRCLRCDHFGCGAIRGGREERW